MNVFTADLIGPALDWAVGKAIGLPDPYFNDKGQCAQFSTDWAHGGPLIEREEIFLSKSVLGDWGAAIYMVNNGCIMYNGPTPLIAAMRVLVGVHSGEVIDVPIELVKED